MFAWNSGRHRSDLSLRWIPAQIKPEHLFFGLGGYEERNRSVSLVGEIMLFRLNVQISVRLSGVTDPMSLAPGTPLAARSTGRGIAADKTTSWLVS